MQKDTFSHIRDGDDYHDQQGAEHEAFAPSLQNICLFVIYISPVSKSRTITTVVWKTCWFLVESPYRWSHGAWIVIMFGRSMA